VSSALLTLFKAVFLALLYLFVFWAIRAARADLRTERPVSPLVAPTPRERRAAPQSVVLTDERGTELRAVPLAGPVQVGRSESCQIVLADTFASSVHARLFDLDGAWFVEDLDSTNGTYLNDRRVSTPAELKVGDRLRIGRTMLEIRS